MILYSHTEDSTIRLGKKIGSCLHPGDIIVLNGELAAGKTTITKGIAAALGIFEPVTSPTFTLISEYEGTMPLYHMDVYRLNSAEDFIDTGGEELIYGEGVCIIEWGEKIMPLLPGTAIRIKLTLTDKETRKIEIINWPYGEIELE